MISGLSTAAYLLTSRALGYIGFPLDDAWIHQTFARNLAVRGEWAFVPGQPAAGSTSPLWTLILAVGYALRVEYHAWAYLCGWAMLTLVALLTFRLALRLSGDNLGPTLAGIFVALEWHLVWAGVSGMETLLFSALTLLALEDTLSPSPDGSSSAVRRGGRGLRPGLTIGAAILARPDGLTLLPFVALGILLAPRKDWRTTLTRFGIWLLGFGILFSIYLAFNYYLSGAIWPNTFYAKQAEYAILRDAPYLVRLARIGAAPFVGGLTLLLPGIALSVADRLRRQEWKSLLPLTWSLAFLALYAWRLPVTYQHARYLLPAIPPLIAYGFDGLAGWARLNAPLTARRSLSRVWALSLAGVTAAFWLIGARAYGADVRIIETEMVATARWLAADTPPGALIAVHDIGAVGYFSDRQILDLAGLISPEVIPIIRDERALAGLIAASRAEYLVTFPGWYPRLVAGPQFVPVYATRAPFSPAAGGENMTVYRVIRGD